MRGELATAGEGEDHMTREQLVKIAREVVEGINRPSYCDNPASFDPHEWVLEAMQRAYERGRADGQRGATALDPRSG